jgi:hypothetical protein
VVAVLPFGEAELGGVNLRLLVALGVPHRGGRLVGVSGPLVARAPAVFVLDFDRDGIDDVLLAAQDGYSIAELGP